jgi:hypothetical protein
VAAWRYIRASPAAAAAGESFVVFLITRIIAPNVQRLLEKYFGSQIPCDVMMVFVWSLVSWYFSVTNRS